MLWSVDVTDPKTFKSVVTGLHLVQTFVKMFPDDVTMYQSISKKAGIEDLNTKVSPTHTFSQTLLYVTLFLDPYNDC